MITKERGREGGKEGWRDGGMEGGKAWLAEIKEEEDWKWRERSKQGKEDRKENKEGGRETEE